MNGPLLYLLLRDGSSSVLQVHGSPLSQTHGASKQMMALIFHSRIGRKDV